MKTLFVAFGFCCFIQTAPCYKTNNLQLGEDKKRIIHSPYHIQSNQLRFEHEDNLSHSNQYRIPASFPTTEQEASSSEILNSKLKLFRGKAINKHSPIAGVNNNDQQIEAELNGNEKSEKTYAKHNPSNIRKALTDRRHPFWIYLLHHRAGSDVSVDSYDVCDKPYLDGCSVPFGAPFFFKELFTPSCFRHDVCYRCGIDYNHNRLECDEVFRSNMAGACSDAYFKTVRSKIDNKSTKNRRSSGNQNENRNNRKSISISNKYNNLVSSFQVNRESRQQNSTINDEMSKLYSHKQVTFATLNSLQTQFDKILQDKLSASMNVPLSHGRLRPLSKNNKFTKNDFRRHTEFIKFHVIKDWFKLLHKTLSSLRTSNESLSSETNKRPMTSKRTASISTNDIPEGLKNMDNYSNYKNVPKSPRNPKYVFTTTKSHDNGSLQETDNALNHRKFILVPNFLNKICESAGKSGSGSGAPNKGFVHRMCNAILDEIVQQHHGGTDLTSDTIMAWQDLPDLIEYFLCLFFKEMYYWAVRFFGESSYQTTARSFCAESYVVNCLPD